MGAVIWRLGDGGEWVFRVDYIDGFKLSARYLKVIVSGQK